jgi:uncharacterized protein (UPF0305 family)
MLIFYFILKNLHFPDLMTILKKNNNFNVDMSYREVVLTNITKKIVNIIGQLKPSVYEFREYDENKAQITERLKTMKHFTQENFPNWEQVLLQDTNVAKTKDNFDDVSSDENEHLAYRGKNQRGPENRP